MATNAQINPTKSNRFLDRERTVVQPGFNRWLVPSCALAIHLCIGLAYGFSVFWLPLSRVIGVANPVVCKSMTLGQVLVTTSCDWRVSDLVWTYSIFFVVLGTSAAIWGGWLERAGPRKAGVVAACCWRGGIAIGAVGVSVHQLWLLWLGTGLIGGIGLGLGYISPVSTLIKWFPDKRGMATGLAIMGFGGGALLYGIAAPVLMGGSVGLFILVFCLGASMYGGGFSTVPAYLADTFGTKFVGAIRGRVLTAWSFTGSRKASPRTRSISPSTGCSPACWSSLSSPIRQRFP